MNDINIVPLLRWICGWAGTVILGIVAAVAMLDYGGVLPWTRWATGVGCGVAALIALPALALTTRWHWTSLVWPLAFVVVAICTAAQTIPLPAGLVSWLSPATADAYALLTPPVNHHPTSLSSWSTRLYLLTPVIVGLGGLIGTCCFRDQRTAVGWLMLVTLCGAMLGLLGIGERLRRGEDYLWPATQQIDAVPFGPYVNRNNAACQLNLTLACALGGVVYVTRRNASGRGYRSAVFTRRDRNRTTFLHDIWYAMLRADGTTILATTMASMIAIAILWTGSRGAALGAASGLAAVCVVLSGRGRTMAPRTLIGIGVVTIAGLIGLVALLQAIDPHFAAALSDVINDARWGNWRDALSAAWHHLPLGAGAGNYRFAYLPFQNTSSGAWFVNADSLPLEWFVEYGLLGLILPAALACFLIQQCLWLRRSSQEAIDRAAAATGVFLVISQSVSQSFDFGLLQLPALITLGMTAGFVLARAAELRHLMQASAATAVPQTLLDVARRSSGSTRSDAVDGRRWTTPALQFAAPALCMALLGGLLWSTLAWRDEAQSDHIARVIQNWDTDRAVDERTLQQMIKRTERLVQHAPASGTAKKLLAKLLVLQSRHAAMKDFRPLPNFDRRQAWQATSLAATRARYFSISGSPAARLQTALFPDQSPASLLRAAELNVAALRDQPLDDRPRLTLAKLDFLPGGAEQTQQKLVDYASLRRRSADHLTTAARLAIWNPGSDLTRQLYRQAFDLDPRYLVLEWPTISQLPQDQAVALAATAGLLPLLDVAERNATDTEMQAALIRQAASMLDDPAATSNLTVQQTMLARGRVAGLQKDASNAARHFEQAVADDPNSIEPRYRLAVQLQQLGRLQQASQQLRILQSLAPTNPQVQALANQVDRELASAGR